MMTPHRTIYTQCYACTDPVVGGPIDHEAEPLIRPGDVHFHLCDPCAVSLLGIWSGEPPPSHTPSPQPVLELDGAVASPFCALPFYS